MTGNAVSSASGAPGELSPVIHRLTRAVPCSPELIRRVEALGSAIETAQARTELQAQDEPVRRPRYVLAGWACRYRNLPDGRRQIFDLVLPGEGVGVCLRPHPIATTNTLALTPMRLVDASPLLTREAMAACPEITAAVQAQADADERRTLNQVIRLGRLTALERLAHLLMELRERLDVIGKVEGTRFSLPVTQETLADMTGLSVVHVNRTLQELRRQGLLHLDRGWVRLLDMGALEHVVDLGLEPSPRRQERR